MKESIRGKIEMEDECDGDWDVGREEEMRKE